MFAIVSHPFFKNFILSLFSSLSLYVVTMETIISSTWNIKGLVGKSIA